MALCDRLQEAEESARSERESLAEHVSSVENRALGDLDRGRQESKVLQAQLASTVMRHAAIEQKCGVASKRHAQPLRRPELTNVELRRF